MRGILTAAALLSALVACGDDGGDNGDDGGAVDDLQDEVQEEAEERADETGARAAAETVRASLTARDAGDDEHLRDMSILEDAMDTVPGSPEVTGLEDSTGDGRDDDGLVTLTVDDASACVSVTEQGDSVDVEGGECY